VVAAILFPLFLGFAAFLPAVVLLELHDRDAPPVLLVAGVSAAWAALFGLLYFRGLRQGRRATPPMHFGGRRSVFALALAIAAGWVVYGVATASDYGLYQASDANLAADRWKVEWHGRRIRELERDRQNSPELEDERRGLVGIQAHLARLETAKARVAGGGFLAAMFVLGSAWAWVDAVRAWRAGVVAQAPAREGPQAERSSSGP
jgi:hypothetical protein